MDGRFEPQRDRDGTITEWFGLSIDIDDEVRVQDELRERERFLWQLVETLPAMIVCSTPEGRPIYRSEQLRAFLGGELAGPAEGPDLPATLDAIVHPDDLAGVRERYAHSLATGAPYARRHRLRRFDGTWRWVETRAAPMRDAAGAIVQWNHICLDIDAEVAAQEELRLAHDNLARATQAASLAELSASIAHEVNQPLAAIVANSNACHRWLSAEPPNIDRAKITAERIVRDANSAADVVSRIRALFRHDPDAREPVALGDVIREARELTVEEAVRRGARVEVEVEEALPALTLDRVQVQQVLVNLIRNGLEAMEDAAGERILRIRAWQTEGAIRTEVSDTGTGIEFPDSVFQPFFTTKAQGMGMGLAICRSIVEAHGGRLWAEASAPRGARFVFTLPVAAKAEA
jgi:PAS domain S-box-containing protein